MLIATDININTRVAWVRRVLTSDENALRMRNLALAATQRGKLSGVTESSVSASGNQVR